MIVSCLIQAEYNILFIHFLVTLGVGAFIFGFSFFLISQKANTEKLSPYECGFDPFGDSRNTFNIHFYLVGILFIIFDLEIMYLFPWAITIERTGFVGFATLFIFLAILTIGFIYEWLKGALNWT